MADGREGGFIKLHRRIKSWPLYRAMSAEQRQVVTEILFAARWHEEPGEFWVGSRRFEVPRGALFMSAETLAKEAGTSRKVVRTVLAKLSAEGFITHSPAIPGHGRGQHAGRCPHLITVVNYGRYQGWDDDGASERANTSANCGPIVGQQGAPNEEGKEGKTSGDPLAEWRRGVAAALCVMGSNPLRIADGARAKAMRVDIATLGVGPAIDIATEAARDSGKVPGTADWFAPILRRAAEQGPTPTTRAPHECPKPGDPDFNDQNAYPTYEAYLNRGRAHA